MANLRQAASESMFSDTVLFENAARLAKLIGYYAKGQSPYTLIARLTSSNTVIPEFGMVSFGYGPYNYNFSVVEHNVNNDQKLIRLALGSWNHREFTSDGTKFQEFIVENDADDPTKSTYISQKFVRVITRDLDGKTINWEYSQTPLFLRQDKSYRYLDADVPEASRTELVKNGNVYLFNFYIDENANYVLKFGDGLSTAIPSKGSSIYIFYVTSSDTDKTITAAAKSAIANSSEGQITSNFDLLLTTLGLNYVSESSRSPTCIPTTQLMGYRDIDSVEKIKQFSREAFNRQNRLVTKQDYHDYLLEAYPEWKDVCVENNWEYISTFYGWLYAINPNLINVNNLQLFNSSDPADANNIYIWFLSEDMVDSSSESLDVGENVGIERSMNSGEDIGKSIGSIKDITEHPVFLYALCKRWVPCAFDITDQYLNLVQYENPNPFNPERYISYFRIHIDSNNSNKLNYIKTETYKIFKKYLFDDIKLGKTPSIPSLIKDLMLIDGVVNVTTVFNTRDGKDDEGNPSTEIEVNGMKFLTWTDTNNQLLTTDSENSDRAVSYNLPNIPEFQFFKSAQPYSEFIENSLNFKVDYTL